MIKNLETLVQLAHTGTMKETATRMNISQGAVSKRIAAIENYYGKKIIERHGRRVVLTQHGRKLVDRTMPLLQEVRSVFLEDTALQSGRIIVGVSESILGSWGSRLFAAVRADMPEVNFEFHAQRSPVVLDRLRSGELMVGICTGSADAESDLQSDIVYLESMVIVPTGLKTMQYRVGDPLQVMTIESRSGAWAAMEDDMERLNLTRATSLESFFSVAQMALADFGHGLIPLGVANALSIATDQTIDLGSEGLNRPVRFVARKSMYSRTLIQSFYDSIRRHTRDGSLTQDTGLSRERT
ncbi:MAG: LysR family transcriptional regulator [Pseudomonadales bacterium]|nr:LysR family transcriptional regulator [Pseudomonadales bacterium]